MNQILITNDKKDVEKKPISSIIKFFVVIIILFALILCGQGIYNLYKDKQNKGEYIKPELSVEKLGSTMKLKVDGKTEVNKINYSWNNGNVITINCDGKKSVDTLIEIPQGDNKLDITVVDVRGNKTKFDTIEVSFLASEDTVKPTISLVNSTGKIVVTISDETELDYISYKWEDEQEVKVLATEETKKSIVQEVKVQKGTKKLTITAVDKAGNIENITKKVVGSNGPKVVVTLEENNFIVKVTDEYKLTKIEYTLNDSVVNVDNIPADAKEFEFKVPVQEGANYLKINAYDENDLMTEYKCKKTK